MYFEIRLWSWTKSSGRWHSAARTEAVIVLPQPGGPTRRSLRFGVRPCDRRTSRCRCCKTISSMRTLTESDKTMSARRVEG